ncbi:hypothetical protein K488DRAFT_53649, partial [Vararia minispora EC-137]
YFMLGRVPCLSVRLYGLLVGVQERDSALIYHIDDGTAIIDCLVKYPKGEEGEPYIPVADTTDTVKVIGKVHERGWARDEHEKRYLVCSSIELCRSNQEELSHWKGVLQLHTQTYDLATPMSMHDLHAQVLGPSRPSSPSSLLPIFQTALAAPRTPTSKHKQKHAPSPARSDASCASSVAPSPTKSIASSKLRHPSRIRRKDVTESLFRDYLLHYMTYGPPPDFRSDCGENIPVLSPSMPLATPTKRQRHRIPDETPRPSKHTRIHDVPLLQATSTPRPSRQQSALVGHKHETHGFTLSHLRRVPELALMADKLYRSTHEKARKMGVAGAERSTRKTKRLFEGAVNDLRLRSTVTLWDGPTHPLPRTDVGFSDVLWRMRSSRSQANASALSSASQFSQVDLGELSDPPSDEESYVLLTPDFLARYVEVTIKKLTDPDRATALLGMRSYRKQGPTLQEITDALKGTDERWAKISEYNVREALQLLDGRGRVWQASPEGGGRWELTM